MNIDKLDKYVKENFRVSLMNDSKWEKLITCVTEITEQVHVNYKLVHSSSIKSTSFMAPDFKPYFDEPVVYKEVEWMEFPSEYENYISENNLKAGKKLYSQNVDNFKRAIVALGEFDLETNKVGIRVYAYR